jgi:hypothetical protein
VGGAPASGGPTREDVARIADDIDLKLREESAGAAARAKTLSEYPRVSKVVATDAATVADMVNQELTFRPGDGETIEIGQITADDKPATLLRMPADSRARPPLDKPGVSFTAGDRTLLVSNVINVKPSEDTGVKAGRVAVTWTVDLAPFIDRLTTLNVPARVELAGNTAAATPAAFPAGVEPIALPIKTAPGARLLAAVHAADDGKLSPIQLGGVGVAALGLILAAVLWRRGGATPQEAPAGVKPVSSPSTFTPAPTGEPSTPASSSRSAATTSSGGSARAGWPRCSSRACPARRGSRRRSRSRSSTSTSPCTRRSSTIFSTRRAWRRRSPTPTSCRSSTSARRTTTTSSRWSTSTATTSTR